jgi:ribosomal protein S12 methylthiotransferase
MTKHGGSWFSMNGRTKGDAPQIDGAVHIATRRPLRAGDIVTVKIERSDAYDLWGTAA